MNIDYEELDHLGGFVSGRPFPTVSDDCVGHEGFFGLNHNSSLPGTFPYGRF